MSTFIPKLNPVTQQMELIGMAKLVQPLNAKVLEYTNAEGVVKQYKLANASIELPNGAKTSIVCNVNMRNIELMADQDGEFTPGEEYLTTITRVPSTKVEGEFVFFGRMSHLQGSPTDNKALEDAFGDMFVVPATAEKVTTTA